MAISGSNLPSVFDDAPWHWESGVGKSGDQFWRFVSRELEVQTQRSTNPDRRGRYWMSTMICRTNDPNKITNTYYFRDENGEEYFAEKEDVEAYIKKVVKRRGSVDAFFSWGKLKMNPNAPEAEAEYEEQYDVLTGEMVKVAPITGRGRSRSEGSQARGCDNCTLKNNWVKLVHPRMPIYGEADADVLILGEAPGEEEDKRGIPFVGNAGKKLHGPNGVPYRSGYRIAQTNMTRCRPPGNRNPTPSELHACSVHLENDIRAGNFKAILGLGGVPLSRFLTGATITQIHGLKFPVEIAGKVLWYYPTLHPAFILYTAQQNGRGDSPAEPIFQNDLKYFFDNIDKWPDPVIERPSPDDVHTAHSEAEARGWCAKLKRDKPIGLDIETNDLRPTATGAAIMTASVSDGDTTVAWPVFHQGNPTNWGLPLLLQLSEDIEWVAHSAGFELGWLYASAKRANIEWEPHAGFNCSLVAARLSHRRHTALNLGILTRIMLGTDIKSLSTVNVERIAFEPLPEVLQYNGLDAWGCYKVFDKVGQIDGEHYAQLMATIASTTDMQLAGLDTDQEAAHRLHAQWSGRAAAAAAHAQTIYEVRQYYKDHQIEFRLGSDADLGNVLKNYSGIDLPKNTDGSWKTDDKTLTELAPNNPLVKDALVFRHARKMDSTYVLPIIDAATKSEDGKLHPSYSVALVRTLRTSSEDPNIQNYPKRKDEELREPIVAPEGQIFAAADYSSLEFRVYGMASKDRNLCQQIIDGVDAHYRWLDFILDRYPPYLDRLSQLVSHDGSFESIRKGARDGVIKSDFVFASLYGSIAASVSARTGIPLDICYDILGSFWEEYYGAADWLARKRKEYKNSGSAFDLFDRERYAILWGNEMINLPIQGTAARLVLDGQNELHQMSKREKDRHFLPRINVHDDLIFCLPDRDAELMQYMQEIAQVMVKPRNDWQTVPLAVDFRVGYTWASLTSCLKVTGSYHHG